MVKTEDSKDTLEEVIRAINNRAIPIGVLVAGRVLDDISTYICLTSTDLLEESNPRTKYLIEQLGTGAGLTLETLLSFAGAIASGYVIQKLWGMKYNGSGLRANMEGLNVRNLSYLIIGLGSTVAAVRNFCNLYEAIGK